MNRVTLHDYSKSLLGLEVYMIDLRKSAVVLLDTYAELNLLSSKYLTADLKVSETKTRVVGAASALDLAIRGNTTMTVHVACSDSYSDRHPYQGKEACGSEKGCGSVEAC